MACTLLGCEQASKEPAKQPAEPSQRRFPLTDTDSDGMDDDWETTYFGNLSRSGTGDYDADGMTDLNEYTYDFVPDTHDAFDDADGDRYPNVFEIEGGSDPTDNGSTPSADVIVDPATGGASGTDNIYVDIKAAVTAADNANDYQIMLIKAGTYSGSNNSNVTINMESYPFLVLGEDGAADTTVDGGGTAQGFIIYSETVVSSLTFQNLSTRALWVSDSNGRSRFEDLVVRDNTGSSSFAGALHVASATFIDVVGCTFLNNTSAYSYAEQIYQAGTGTLRITNTAVWGSSTEDMFYKAAGVTLTASYSLIKGETLSGTGNLAGTTDPDLNPAARPDYDSPLIAAGTDGAYSKLDFELETRPTTPDIGADQFVDSDTDEIADAWELEQTGNLTTLTSRTADNDSDGLTNGAEYLLGLPPTDADADDDGLNDGDEVNTYGTDPWDTDTDDDGMPDAWEAANGVDPVTANALDDEDGDRYPNIFEYMKSTDPDDDADTPDPDQIVDPANGGTSGTDNIYTTVSSALSAANAEDDYQIIELVAGTYTNTGDINVSVSVGSYPILILGEEGAAKTIIDGQGSGRWWIYSPTTIGSLTFQNLAGAIDISASTYGVRLTDLLFIDNASTDTHAGAVKATACERLDVVHCTFLNNTAGSASANAQQLYQSGSGSLNLSNTVIWGEGSEDMFWTNGSVSVAADHSLIKGETLSGTGNLSGTTDPKLTRSGRLRWDSPLLDAGTLASQSQVDFDLEVRPATTPDIGVDQFVDSDSDDLADAWEVEETSNLTTLTSRTADSDSDNLDNGGEYAAATPPLDDDADDDTLLDGDEVNTYGTDPWDTDTDADDMPDVWEVDNGLDGADAADKFQDADHDRYPNVFEYAGSSEADNSASTPAPDYLVDPSGGGDVTTIGDAVSSANTADGEYQIIAIEPGTYTGEDDLDLQVGSGKPTLLFIGLDGAAATVLDGELRSKGLTVNKTAYLASLTLRRLLSVSVDFSAIHGELYLSDVVIRDCETRSTKASAVAMYGAKLGIYNSVFLNNASDATSGEAISVSRGDVEAINLVVWTDSSSDQLYVVSSQATFSATYSLIKGETLSGTGNLSGTTDPSVKADGSSLPDSPLRGAGGMGPFSRYDRDLELRPTSTPDMGVDQWNDSDSDGVPDGWELAVTGNLTTLTGGDTDSDGLDDLEEYEIWDADGTLDPTNDDTDGDGMSDGDEITYGSDPLVFDPDNFALDLNGDGIIDALGSQLDVGPYETDDDSDGLSNSQELVRGTDPLRSDTDGDGVGDASDPFPLDPDVSSLPTDPEDETGPGITLVQPANATLVP